MKPIVVFQSSVMLEAFLTLILIATCVHGLALSGQRHLNRNWRRCTFLHDDSIPDYRRRQQQRRNLVVPSQSCLRFTLPPGATAVEAESRHSANDVGSVADFNTVRVRVESLIKAPPHQVRSTWKHLVQLGRPTRTPTSKEPFLWSQLELLEESDRHLHCQIFRYGFILKWLDDDAAKNDTDLPFMESTVRFDDHLTDTNQTFCHFTWDLSLRSRSPEMVKTIVTWRMNAISDSLVGLVGEPRLLTRRLRLPPRTSSSESLDAWLDFIWHQGGGLPTPLPPLVLPSSKATTGSDSNLLTRRLIFPPGLMESLVSVDREIHQVQYQVDNPGMLTYQVYTHRGRVRFYHAPNDTEGRVVMEWQVEIRPFPGFQHWVEAFTEAVVTTLTRNLAVHLAHPREVVHVYLPRGKGASLASVRKDSWLGGVLEAHLSDRRSTVQQTLSMFQPWTWGRATDDVKDAASTSWTVGSLPS